MKYYYVPALLCAVSITLIAITGNETAKYLLVAAAIILHFATIITFAAEYDRQMMQAWDRREKKLLKK